MSNSDVLDIGKTIHELLEKLPSSLHQRALRFRREEDAYNFVLGRLLLQQGLQELKLRDTIEDIQFETSGKPYLDSVAFNISHTAGKVVCAISEHGKVGVDIEKEIQAELTYFEPWFTPQEWQNIHEASIPLHRFYRYWTRKESIIKALGLTLSDLHQIELDINQDVFEEKEKAWYLQDLNVGAGYVGAICSEESLEVPVLVREVEM